jgi:hypothetical protein
MSGKLKKWLIIFGACLAVILPIAIHIKDASWENSSLIANVFPIFGLMASTLLWLHAISGVFEEWLRKHFDFDAFVYWTALLILVSIISHPLLLLILIRFNIVDLIAEHPQGISLGIVGFVLLITYDLGKFFRKYDLFVHHWNKILVVSTIGYLLTFVHSLLLGSDLQGGFLRGLWIFYGATAVLATIYTYGLKRFLVEKHKI